MTALPWRSRPPTVEEVAAHADHQVENIEGQLAAARSWFAKRWTL